jgi:peptidyl-prolyl cis-trans isomerase D
MLQAIRTKMHGWPSIILLGICVVAMSLFGMESYFTSRNDTFVAKVGKIEISQNDFQTRTNQLRQQESEQQGDKFDSSVFEKPETKLRILDAMVDQQLLLQANDDWGMRVSDTAVRDYISTIPGFQVNNAFDPTTYRTWLISQRKTPEGFDSEIRASLAGQLVPDAINDSAIITDASVDHFLGLISQRRDVRYFILPKPKLADSTVTDQQIDAYYKAHQAEYMSPEQVSVKYLEVDSADIKPDAAPTEDDLKKRYDEEKQRFVQPDQRLVSHILINVPANATPDQQKAALAKADKIAAQANAGNFATLAKQDSQDLGSKAQGGDLGWLQKGMTNGPFEAAMLALQKGQISKPVLSPEGYHIIYLRDLRSGDAKPFSEVRDQLVKELSTGGKDRKYNDIAGKLVNNTYQNPSSLEPAATAMSLPIKTTPLFARTGGAGLAANPKFIAAAFGDDVMVQGNNSSLIDLGGNHSVVLHIDKHVPAAVRPLADVRADVQKKILDERTLAAGKAEAETLLARLRKGEAMPAVAATGGATVKADAGVVRSQQPGAPVTTLPPPLLKQTFLLAHPTADKPQFASVDMQDGTYALLALDKVQDGDLTKVAPQERDALRQQMAQAYGSETTRELIEQLRAKTKITINKNLM